MRTVQELFNGGVVTSRIGAMLESGELQRADDCIYREKDPAVWRAPGRTVYNSSALTLASVVQPVKGLGYLSFNGFTDQILVAVGQTMFRSDFTAITGTFSEVSMPSKVAGVVSASTTFTATAGNVFTADVVGSRVYGTTSTTGIPLVTATSGAADADGRFAAIVVDLTITGTTSIALDWGTTPTLNLSAPATSVMGLTRWDNQYFVYNGVDPILRLGWRRRAYSGGTPLNPTLVARPAGLAEVVTAPTITTGVSTTGTWTALLGSGTFWFLITEIYAPGGDVAAAERDPYLAGEVVESAYLGTNTAGADPNNNKGRPIPVSLTSGSTTVPTITFPPVVNDGTRGRLATNWGVYMYGPTTTNTDVPSLALFRRVATPSITATSVTLQESPVDPEVRYPTAVAAGFGSTIVTNFARITGAPDNSFTGVDSILGSTGDTPGHAARVSTFGFVTATGIITGIEVTVRARSFGTNAFIDVQASTSGGKKGAMYQKDFSHALFSPAGTITVGGPTDTMGLGLLVGELGNLRVDVGIEGASIGFDSVAVKLYFAGGLINLDGPAYRVVTYRDQVGITVNDPANLAPAICSTAEVWQGSLVTNDINVDGALRYSIVARPEAQPKPYILKFRDRGITMIVAMGERLIVGMRNTVKRVNYLPRETDTDMNSGLAWENIASDHGIPGPFCGVKFSMPGKGEMFAYVSTSGIFVTNGLWTIPLNMDLDWANTVKLSALGTACLRVYPKEKLLALYYCPAGATHSRNTRVLYFCYQADKVKGNGLSLPAIGPCVVSARSSAEAFLDGDYLLTGQETDGKVYVEDSGLSIPSGYQVTLTATASTQGDGKAASGTDVKIVPFIRSRKFYSASLDRDGYGEKIYLLYSAYGSNSVTASSTLVVANTTITSVALFGSVVPGMRVLGTGMDPGTIVVSKSDSSTIVVSRAPNTSGTVTLTFDTGTIGLTIRGSSLGENVKGLRTDYVSTLVGDLTDVHNSNMRRGFEIQVEKVPLTFDSNGDTLTWADLSTNMRLHSVSYMVDEQGLPDTSYNAA